MTPTDANFSFENDIAPLQQRYFKSVDNANLTTQQRINSKSNMLSFEDRLDDRRNKRNKDRLGVQILDQRVQINKVALTEARDKAQRERENNTNLDVIIDRVKGIRAMPISDHEKRDLLNDYMIDNGKMVSQSPAAQGVFRVANQRYADGIAEDKAATTQRNHLVGILAGKGQTAGARKLLGDDADTQAGQDFLTVSEAVNKENVQRINQANNTTIFKAQADENAATRKRKLDLLDSADTTLNGLTYTDKSGGQDEHGNKLPPRYPQLDEKSLGKLRRIASQLMPSKKAKDPKAIAARKAWLDLIEDSGTGYELQKRIRNSIQQGRDIMIPEFQKPQSAAATKWFE